MEGCNLEFPGTTGPAKALLAFLAASHKGAGVCSHREQRVPALVLQEQGRLWDLTRNPGRTLQPVVGSSRKTSPQRKMKFLMLKEPGLHLATLFEVLPSSSRMGYWSHAPREKWVMHPHVRGTADGFCISSTEIYSPTTLLPLYLGIHITPCLFSITNPIIFLVCKAKCIELLEMPTLYLHSCQLHCLQSRCYFYHMLSRKQLPLQWFSRKQL